MYGGGCPAVKQTEEPFCVKGDTLGLLRINGPAAGRVRVRVSHCVLMCLPTVQRVISTRCQGQKGPVRNLGEGHTSEEVICRSLSDSTPLENAK